MNERRKAKQHGGEAGHLMAGLMVVIAIMVIGHMAVYQNYADVLQRDNEAEMIFRGRDLARAILRYRRDHGGAAPLKFEDLMEPGPKGQYYLRKLWKDPLVKDGKWGLLYVGPNGQILDPNNLPDPNALAGGPGAPGGLGGAGSLANRAASPFNKRRGNQSQGLGQGGPGQPGQAGQGLPGQPGQPGLNIGPDGEITGLPIAGVRTLSSEKPFRIYKGLADYEQWLFTYLEMEAEAATGTSGQTGVPGGSAATPGQPGQQGLPGQSGLSGRPGGSGRPGLGGNRRNPNRKRPGGPR